MGKILDFLLYWEYNNGGRVEMKNIINALYHLQVNAEFPNFGKIDKEQNRKEWEFYQRLHEELSGTLKEIFIEYTDLLNTRYNLETQAAYEQGFKTAVSLIIEALKE